MSESRKQAIELLKEIIKNYDDDVKKGTPKSSQDFMIGKRAGRHEAKRLALQAFILLESEQAENERVLDFLSFPIYLMLSPFCEAVGEFNKKVIVFCADKAAMDKMDVLLSDACSEQSENERLKKFARRIIKEVCWNISEPDGGDIQDIAEKLGLIKPVKATENDIDEYSEFEVGDTIFKFTDLLKGE